MESAYKKIFWGVILATINITLGPVTIFPTFVGWLVVLSGLSKLEEAMADRQFSVAYWSVIALVLITFAEGVITFSQGPGWTATTPFLFYPVMLLLFELTAFHKLLGAAVDRFNKNNREITADSYNKKHRVYLVLMGVSLTLLTVAIILNHTTLFIFSTLLTLFSTVYLITVIYSIRQESHSMRVKEAEQ